MWSGYLDALKYYFNCCVDEWIKRGYKNTMDIYEIDEENINMPWWFTWRSLQLSHICSLLRKDPECYNKLFTLNDEENKFMNYGYIWIDNENKSVNRKTKKSEILLSSVMSELTCDYCSDIGTGAPPQYRYTKEEITKWLNDKSKNPKTNRPIKSTGNIYKDLEKANMYYFKYAIIIKDLNK